MGSSDDSSPFKPSRIMQMLMEDDEEDDHIERVRKAVLAVAPLLMAYYGQGNDDAANTRTRKRRRRAQKPLAIAAPTDANLMSDAGSAHKPNINKNKKNKISISPQPNNPQSLCAKQIFILSGHGNMSGRGGVFRNHRRHHLQQWDGVVSPECGPHPDIHRLDAERLRWEPAREPLHADVDARRVCGVGPGMAFANAVRGRMGAAVGLVPCAGGGTAAMEEWARGGKLYEGMVERARESVTGGGEIKGLLWCQGESDTWTQDDADAYQGNMVKLIENVREDLGLPSLPIIQVAIGCGDKKYMEKVRDTQLGMEVPNVVCVDAKGLELQDDNLHLTTKAQVQLGQMLADAYLKHFGSS